VYYGNQKKLVTVDGMAAVAVVTTAIDAAVKAHSKP
jgi:hypothetical protein